MGSGGGGGLGTRVDDVFTIYSIMLGVSPLASTMAFEEAATCADGIMWWRAEIVGDGGNSSAPEKIVLSPCAFQNDVARSRLGIFVFSAPIPPPRSIHSGWK